MDERDFEILDKKVDIASGVDLAIEKEMVEKYLILIPEKYREPLLLFFFEEKTYEEISDILQIPINTVGVRLLRGKEMLKKFLTSQSYGK